MSKYHKKVLRKQGECIFGNEKPVSFQSPKAGPRPWPTSAHFATLVIYAKRNLGPPLNQILDPLLGYPYVSPDMLTPYLYKASSCFLNLCTSYFCSTNQNSHGHGCLNICWPLADGQLQKWLLQCPS